MKIIVSLRSFPSVHPSCLKATSTPSREIRPAAIVRTATGSMSMIRSPLTVEATSTPVPHRNDQRGEEPEAVLERKTSNSCHKALHHEESSGWAWLMRRRSHPSMTTTRTGPRLRSTRCAPVIITGSFTAC